MDQPVSAPDGPDASKQAPAKGPYLFWGSLGWFALAGFAWAAAQLGAFLVMMLPQLSAHPGAKIDLTAMISDAKVVAAVTMVSTPFAVAVLILAARVRNWGLADYFALRRFGWKQFGYGFAAVLAVLLAAEGIGAFTGHDSQPDFMHDLFSSARQSGAWLLLALAAVIVAPVGEEIVFRGFLYRGLAASRLGVLGAIVLTSALWALIHQQYDWFYVAVIFVLGVTLGAVRAWSGSTSLTIVLHALVNAASFAQALMIAEAA